MKLNIFFSMFSYNFTSSDIYLDAQIFVLQIIEFLQYQNKWGQLISLLNVLLLKWKKLIFLIKQKNLLLKMWAWTCLLIIQYMYLYLAWSWIYLYNGAVMCHMCFILIAAWFWCTLPAEYCFSSWYSVTSCSMWVGCHGYPNCFLHIYHILILILTSLTYSFMDLYILYTSVKVEMVHSVLVGSWKLQVISNFSTFYGATFCTSLYKSMLNCP